MRSTRALFASLGAGASLVAAGALCLLALSAVIALGGWPGLSDAQPREALVLADETLAAAERPPGLGLAAASIVLPEEAEPADDADPAGETAEPAAVAEEPADSAPVTPTPVSAPAPLDTTTGSAPAPDAPDQGANSPEPRSGDLVRDLGDGVAGGVQTTGEQLGGVTGQLSPELGQAVEDVTGLIALTLGSTGHLLAGTLDHVVPAAP